MCRHSRTMLRVGWAYVLILFGLGLSCVGEIAGSERAHPNRVVVPHSDLLYLEVEQADHTGGWFQGRTQDGNVFRVDLSPEVRVRTLRNLEEAENDCTSTLPRLLAPGRKLFAYGTFFPLATGSFFEGQKLYLLGTETSALRFEDEKDWWKNQIRALAEFYLKAQFPDGIIDYRSYRTAIALDGCRKPGHRQETDTISRLVYGFASAYLLTGDERYLEAADAGTRFLRESMSHAGPFPGTKVWLHALDRDPKSGMLKRILPSQFRDDLHAIPLYEQIYALAGPVQTLRITGDPRIIEDVEQTQALFDSAFRDPVHGGYFSHVDTVRFSPDAVSLGKNRNRKNWNSIGDHAPAFLINYFLATGKPDAARRLCELADLIVERFPGRVDDSPFVCERFHADWTPDLTWSWQQNRAVVGHNLKIAWNLMRIWSVSEAPKQLALAKRLAETMPSCGLDRQRGGWYDVVERKRDPQIGGFRFAWHDRKAWWQQEQAILAYLILGGETGEKNWLDHARDASAFYNTWFLDHDDGGVYFSVTADGIPYLRGDERLKGSHSMSGYHSFELCYLAAVYTNLLVRGRPLDLYFRPSPAAERCFRVAPDLLPPKTMRIDEVEIDGKPFSHFDSTGLTVALPTSEKDLRLRVRLVPAVGPAAAGRNHSRVGH